MKREELSGALSALDERYIWEALELEPFGEIQTFPEEVPTMKKNPKQAHKLARRNLLIAAMISVFFAVTAFALGYSIHQQRQQDLRQRMQIEEHKVTSYVEYPVPTEEAGPVPDEMTVTLLSSSLNGAFVNVYFNVSPIDESVLNLANDEDSITIACSMGDGWRVSQLIPRASGYRWNKETDPFNLDDFLYDRESKTVTLVSSFSSQNLKTGEAATVTVEQWPDEKELGSFTIKIPEPETRTCLFDVPLDFSNEELENGGRGQVLGIELNPAGMLFLVEHEDSESLHGNGKDFEKLSQEERDRIQLMNATWSRAVDKVTRGTLHMADGTDFEVLGCNSCSSYENGIAKWFADWPMQTIDINAVTAITINGTRIDLN